jgi:hypothetical protein
MKAILLALLLLPLVASAHSEIPDIPPDASSREYRSILRQQMRLLGNDGLNELLRAGERNLDWLAHINSFRQDAEKLSFTSRETQRGIPIDAANEYSPTIILTQLEELQQSLPAALVQVIFQEAPFTDNPPVAIPTYLEAGRKIDRLYQTAARWRTMSPWLPSLESRRRNDIRGYYFLSRMENREEKLGSFPSLGAEERTRIEGWLTGMCLNASGNLNRCRSEVRSLVDRKGDLNAYYNRHESRSSTLFRSYFTIPAYAIRSDFRWEALPDGESKLITPFLDPGRDDVRHFVQFNVQDEFRWKGWRLEMPLVSGGSHPFIVFIPGATPNVNGLGGSRITMDANQPLSEYDAQWTIRHEFGHVLGLPDCYVEFYERERNVIVNYQIDVENIMCSRQGRMKEENFLELMRAYGR